MTELVLSLRPTHSSNSSAGANLRPRTGRSPHRADRAPQSATQCVRRFRSGARARTGPADGCRAQDPRGRCIGLPVTVKSSIATAGYRCEIGSLLHKGDIPREDAVVVARLRAAGALILGTTNCPEFLMAYETAQPAARPHAQSHGTWIARRADRAAASRRPSPRASRRRAWAATAAARCACPRTSPASARSSPRRAAFPGTAICRPASGHSRFSAPSAPWRAPSADVTLLFRTLSGQDPHDPVSPPVRTARAHASTNLRRTPSASSKTMAWSPLRRKPAPPSTPPRQALRDAGFRVEPFRPRTLEQLRKLWWTFFVQCGAMFYAPEIAGKNDQLSPIFTRVSVHRRVLRPAHRDRTAERLGRDRPAARQNPRRDARLSRPAVPGGQHSGFPPRRASWTIDGQKGRLSRCRAPHPMVQCAGRARRPWFRWAVRPEGLPIGVQIVARPFEDEIALGIAAVVDAAFGYRPPPMALVSALDQSKIRFIPSQTSVQAPRNTFSEL